MTATWQNWAGNQQAVPAKVARPRSVDEVATIVKAAQADRQRVKAVGSGHSFTATAVTDGVQVDLSLLNNAVVADAATGLVTVPAGSPLSQLNLELDRHGLAMPNLGDIDLQTVAGATATGTHGTGIRLGGLATQIRAMDIVIGDGSVLSCSADSNADVFRAARVGLGALGIVTAVTLQCEPAFTLVADERPLPLDEVLTGIDGFVDGNDHFEFYWFPHTEMALTKRNNRPRAGDGPLPKPLSSTRRWVDDEFLSNTVFGWTCALDSRWPSLVPRVNRLAARLLTARTYAGPSFDVFVSPRRVKFTELEYSVPRSAFLDAFAAIRRVIERERLQVSFPVEVRFVAPDDIPLSTAYGEERAYLAIHMFRGQPYERYFRGVEAELKALGGRPHWGKMHWRTAEDLRPVYPAFDDFLAVRDALDPTRVFANPYLESVLGP